MVSHETSSTFKISNLVKKLRKSRVVKILSHDAPLSALTGGLRQKMLIVEKKEIIFLAAHHASCHLVRNNFRSCAEHNYQLECFE